MPFAPFDPNNVNAREFHKFKLDTDGEVCVRVCFGAGETFNVTSTPAGLDQGLITVVTVGTSATAIPASAAVDRNHISIHNKSSSQILYVAFVNTVTANDASTGGWEVEAGAKINIDLKEGVIVYGIYPTSSETVKVMEL